MEGGRRGRARGQAGRGQRGRGRIHREEVPRPGQQEAASAQPPPQAPLPPGAQGLPPPRAQGPPPPEVQQQPPAEAAGAMGSGRAARRGTSRAQEARPGEQQVGELAAGVQGMAIQEGAGEGARAEPRRRGRYEDRVFRREDAPKTGTSGSPVALRGNFFRMTVQQNWTVYQYHVDYMPPIEGRKMRVGLLLNHENLIGPVRAFDGMILFLPFKLEHDETVVYSYTRAENQQIKITIKLTCELVDINPTTIQLMNIIWRRFMGTVNMKQINRHYFNMQNKIVVAKHGLEVIPGFQTSVLRYEHDLLLDMDVTHKIMRSNTVLDHLYELSERMGLCDAFYKQAVKEIVGKIVLTRYNNKTYQVDDIYWDGSINNTFEKNNNPITYRDYYRRHYDVTLMDDKQPLLVTRAKKKDLRRGEQPNIYLIPELCIITGLSEENKSDFTLRKDLDTHTKINPEARVGRLTSFMRHVKSEQRVIDELRGWSLNIDDSLVSIQARQLGRQQLIMLDRGRERSLEFNPHKADWSQEMRGLTMKSAPGLHNWVVIVPRRCSENAEQLLSTLFRVGPPMGMNIDQPEWIELEQDRNDHYKKALRDSIVRGQTEMVMCILPNNRKDRYDAIKKHCCVDQPVPSQMVLDRTLKKNMKNLMSVATKIAIQMNCKVGGTVWSAPIPLNRLMIVGIDTYHDSAQKGKSVAGVVATINADYTRYFSMTSYQTSGVELHDQLTSCLQSCVHAFARENNGPPERVIVFRDGVGDGQLDLVRDHEGEQMKSAIGNARLGFIVVKKRSLARFFLEEGGQATGRGEPRGRGGGGGAGRQRYTNPGPGTVIDDVATKPVWYDFFLISQSVREGTVAPTHYNILIDNQGLRPDHYQMMAYKLTHMYYNWQGTIRVPAPCMYAHKLAFLVGQSLHQAPHASLADKLYYL